MKPEIPLKEVKQISEGDLPLFYKDYLKIRRETELKFQLLSNGMLAYNQGTPCSTWEYFLVDGELWVDFHSPYNSSKTDNECLLGHWSFSYGIDPEKEKKKTSILHIRRNGEWLWTIGFNDHECHIISPLDEKRWVVYSG